MTFFEDFQDDFWEFDEYFREFYDVFGFNHLKFEKKN